MSKTDLSLRLLAILRFTIPSNSSRTLNATEAYDVTPSGITLASATGNLVDKSVAVKDVDKVSGYWADVGVGITVTTAGAGVTLESGIKKDTFDPASLAGNTVALTVLSPGTSRPAKKQSANIRQKCDTNQSGNCPPPYGTATSLGFSGASIGVEVPIGLSNNSKATNPNTIFYGGIPVGTGEYKKWQGKYAVLKINTTTGKCVLRIYDA